MGNCKTNIFFHCLSQPHRPSARPEVQAKPFIFQHSQLPFNNQKFSTSIKEAEPRGPREQAVLSSSGQITEPPLPTHCPCLPEKTVSSPKEPHNSWNVHGHFFQNKASFGIKKASTCLALKWAWHLSLHLAQENTSTRTAFSISRFCDFTESPGRAVQINSEKNLT